MACLQYQVPKFFIPMESDEKQLDYSEWRYTDITLKHIFNAAITIYSKSTISTDDKVIQKNQIYYLMGIEKKILSIWRKEFDSKA